MCKILEKTFYSYDQKMGLTQDEIIKISKYSKQIAEEFQREDEKKYAEIRLQELQSQIFAAKNSHDGLFWAREMARELINMFVPKDGYRISGDTNHEYRFEGLTKESILKRLKKAKEWSRENADDKQELEAQFDQILKVLVENNFIQYNCYSTVCHYVYRGKK